MRTKLTLCIQTAWRILVLEQSLAAGLFNYVALLGPTRLACSKIGILLAAHRSSTGGEDSDDGATEARKALEAYARAARVENPLRTSKELCVICGCFFPDSGSDSTMLDLRFGVSELRTAAKSHSYERMAFLLRTKPVCGPNAIRSWASHHACTPSSDPRCSRLDRYLTVIHRELNFSEMDIMTRAIMSSFFGDDFQAHEEQLLLALLSAVLAAEWPYCNDPPNYLRANSFVTKMLTAYTRRGDGRRYLKFVFADIVEEAVALKGSFEVKPEKIIVEMAEKEASNPESFWHHLKQEVLTMSRVEILAISAVHEIQKERITVLLSFARRFLDSILETVEVIPYGVRWICKAMVRAAEDRFPGLTLRDRNLIIGSYVFLRFLSPAIVTPEAFQIVDTGGEPLSGRHRRFLTLVAKVMQNMANYNMFGEQKEPALKPFNDFIMDSRQRLNDYYDTLINVVDPVERYATEITGSSQKGLHFTISPNELFSVHAVLKRNKERFMQMMQKASGTKDPLVQVLNMLTEVPKAIARRDVRMQLLNVLGGHSGRRVDHSSGEQQEEVASVKARLIDVLCEMEAWSESDGMSMLKILGSAQYLGLQIDQVMGDMQALPVAYLVDDFSPLLAEMERDVLHRHVMRSSFNVVERALSLKHKNLAAETEDLRQRKQLYLEYLGVTQLRGFMHLLSHPEKLLRTAEADDGVIPVVGAADSADECMRVGKGATMSEAVGPLRFSLKAMLASKVLEADELPRALPEGSLFDFYTMTPGTGDLVVVTGARALAEFQISIADMLDELAEHRTTRLGHFTLVIEPLLQIMLKLL